MRPFFIPVIIGRNRARGQGVGAMIEEHNGRDTLADLRGTLAREAIENGVEPTREWTTLCVSQLLRLYEDGLEEWRKDKGDTIGFVYEARLPSGRVFAFGEPALGAGYVGRT